jgi:hypothetical protein
MGPNLAPLDARQRRRHKLRNLAQSAILLGGMVGLLALCGWVLFGPDGLLGMALGSALALTFSPKISPRLVLRLYRARELTPPELPELFAVLDRLTQRAGLRRRPRLYYVPSRMLNAFAVGERDDAVIALTDGMLRSLTLRELAGVLGHEISHIRNNDLWLMGLADLVGRLTRLMTLAGLLLLVLAIPLWLGGATALPWLVFPLLVLAPQLTTPPAAGALARPGVRGRSGCRRPDRRSGGPRLGARQARALPARGVGADPDAGLPSARAVAAALASADRAAHRAAARAAGRGPRRAGLRGRHGVARRACGGAAAARTRARLLVLRGRRLQSRLIGILM